jgi:hypothetical protein
MKDLAVVYQNRVNRKPALPGTEKVDKPVSKTDFAA